MSAFPERGFPVLRRARPVFARARDAAIAHPRWTLLLVVTAAYANTLGNLPVLDDRWVIFHNSVIKSLANVPAIFRQPYNIALAGQNAGMYRPIATLSYALNYALGGASVVGYHLVNIALHALCCLLVLEVGRRWTGGALPGSLVGAVLFAVHPVHVEAVTALVGRAELLAALGALLCLHLTSTRDRASWRYPAGLVALLLGVLSKENAAVTPLLFGLVAIALPKAAGLDARPSFRSAGGRRALWRATLLAAGMVAAVSVYFLLRPTPLAVPVASQWFAGRPRSTVLNTMTRAMAQYVRLLVFPHPLGTDFYYSNKIPFTATLTWASAGATTVWFAVLAFGVASWRSAPLRGVGILWVFLALLPVLNIVPIGVLMAERLLYLPSTGFCIAAGVGAVALPTFLAQRPRLAPLAQAAAVAAGAVCLVFAARTWTRNAEWRSPLALYEAEVVKEPNDPVVNNNLAVEYVARGALDRARERLAVTLRVAPTYWRAQVNMGILAHKEHEDSAALTWFHAAHALAPNASDPDYYMAQVLADLGRLPEAVDILARAESVAPTDAWVHLYRGRYLDRLRRTGEAEAEFRRATELDPVLSR